MSPTMEITYRDGSRVMRVVVPVSSPSAVESQLRALGAQVTRTAALSEREQEVAHLVRRGWTNRRIAVELGISEGTVKRHVSIIMDKGGYESRTQLALALGA